MSKGRVDATGCKTGQQHRRSDLMLINGVCCLWLSCQQITPCAKIKHVSCVGLQGRVAWLHQPRPDLKYSPSKRGSKGWELWSESCGLAAGFAQLSSEGQESEGH